MKYVSTLSLLVTFDLILEVSSIISYKEYSTNKTNITFNNVSDLIDHNVSCPNKGVLKTFQIKKDSSQVWFDYSCYSSLTESNEYDESILKALYKTKSYFVYVDKGSIEFNIKCPVDYALSQFIITKENSQKFVVYYACVGVKTRSQNATNSNFNKKFECTTVSLEQLVQLPCGNYAIETDEKPGFPLRGFNLMMLPYNNGKIIVSCKFSFHELRSIELERKEWASKTANQRNTNTQKD